MAIFYIFWLKNQALKVILNGIQIHFGMADLDENIQQADR